MGRHLGTHHHAGLLLFRRARHLRHDVVHACLQLHRRQSRLRDLLGPDLPAKSQTHDELKQQASQPGARAAVLGQR